MYVDTFVERQSWVLTTSFLETLDFFNIRRDQFNFLFYEPAELNFSTIEKKITFLSEDQNWLPCL